MAALAGVQEVIGDHRITGDAGKLNFVAAQDEQVVLDVLIHLGNARVFQNGSELLQCRVRIERGGARGAAHGQVPAFALLPGECQSDDFAPERVETSRFEIDGKSFLLLQLPQKSRELRLGIYQVIRRLPLVSCRWT